MEYDTVICVHPKDRTTALKAIRSIHVFLESRKIFLITTIECFNELKREMDQKIPLYFLDENNLLKDTGLPDLQNIIEKRTGTSAAARWYFQQFLKMDVSLNSEISDHYLIWDADTIVLRPLHFFDNQGHILFNPAQENHNPYFEFTEEALNLKKQVEYSFINEHLMIRKSYMKELIGVFQKKAPDGMSWPSFILNSIKDKNLHHSGFSEFETYGNFVTANHPGIYKTRPVKTVRTGTIIFGRNPNRYDLFRMMLNGTAIITFEKRHQPFRLNIGVQKLKSMSLYGFYFLNKQRQKMRKSASEIAG